MAWSTLIIAGLLECVWAVDLKYSDGFSRFFPSVVTVVTMALSMIFLAYALKTLPISLAYVIWTGIGAVSVALYAILIFSEPANPMKLICISLIIIGMIGLKLSG